jgi:hypothetical protein
VRNSSKIFFIYNSNVYVTVELARDDIAIAARERNCNFLAEKNKKILKIMRHA